VAAVGAGAGTTPLTTGISAAGGVLSNWPHQSFCPVTGQEI